MVNQGSSFYYYLWNEKRLTNIPINTDPFLSVFLYWSINTHEDMSVNYNSAIWISDVLNKY